MQLEPKEEQLLPLLLGDSCSSFSSRTGAAVPSAAWGGGTAAYPAENSFFSFSLWSRGKLLATVGREECRCVYGAATAVLAPHNSEREGFCCSHADGGTGTAVFGAASLSVLLLELRELVWHQNSQCCGTWLTCCFWSWRSFQMLWLKPVQHKKPAWQS